MKTTSLTRRLLVGAAGLAIGTAGALALASPASAHHPIVDGSVVCDEETGEWVISWSVANSEDDLEGTLTSVTSDPAADLTPIAEGATVPMSGDGPLVAEQRVSAETAQASLSVGVHWERNGKPIDGSDQAQVLMEGECAGEEPEEPEEPEPPLVGQVEGEFDCENATVSIINDSEFEQTFTVVPSEGDAVEVTVPAGETSEDITFPTSEGLTIDVQVEDENGELVSVIEEPFEITSDDLADLDCEDEGTGGELPVTGSSTTLIAGGAVLLLAVGGGLFLVARRRRVTFSA